jgi:hypothetical protein
MRSNHVIAAVVVSLSCALISASCVQNPNADTEAAQPEPTAEAQQPAYENVFHFVETLKDDGNDRAGGWQEATARLKFCEWRSTILPVCWQCPIKVGMPMRTAKHGRISHRFAAQITAEVATEVTDSLIYSRPSWADLEAVYCRQLQEEMEQKLKSPPYEVGARVTRP